MSSEGPAERPSSPAEDRLESWKEIAAYLNRGVRTVIRWEKNEGLPVHRLTHEKGATVYALRSELDRWREERRDDLVKEGYHARQRTPAPGSRRLVWVVAAILLAGVAATGWYLIARPEDEAPAEISVTPLTTYHGEEWHPAISPDGTKVTYGGRVAGSDNYDIFMKERGVETPIPVTATEANEGSAVWTSDGQDLIYQREMAPGRFEVLRRRYLGGRERVYTEVFGPESQIHMKVLVGPYQALSPDDNWLVLTDKETGVPSEPFGLFAFSLNPGEKKKRRLTDAPAGWIGDTGPAFSPDGRRIAFHRIQDGGLSEIYVQVVTRNLEPVGGPKRLTFEGGHAHTPAWTPDGEEIIFSMGTTRRHDPCLYRIPASGTAKPVRLEYAGYGAWHPRISLDGNLLVFAKHHWEVNILEYPLDGSEAERGSPLTALSSTYIDTQPVYSPNGKWIAFSSDRSGSREIWISESDGSNPKQRTFLGEAHSCGPRWSPDNESIAFASDSGRNRDIWVVRAFRGAPRRLTDDPAGDSFPEWSAGGEWVYFTSNRSGSPQIWRARAAGGEPVQITSGGGARPKLSPDGRFLYYAKEPTVPTSIWRMPVGGGTEEEVVASSHAVDQFALTRGGVYFTPEPILYGRRFLYFHDLATGETREVAQLEEMSLQCARCMDWEESGLSVSPDGDSILYGTVAEFSSDLMKVEGFR